MRFSGERYMWPYELHPRHLISVATLPCEIQNSENVILQLPMKVASNISYMIHRKGRVDYKIWGVVQQCMYKTKICDICDLQKCLTQTWLTQNRTLSRLRLTSGATVWDHVCVLVVDTLNICCEIIVYLYCVVHQHILWNCQCNLVHLTAIS